MINIFPDCFFKYKINYYNALEQYENNQCKYGRKGAIVVFCNNLLFSYRVQTIFDNIESKLRYEISNITCEDLNSGPIEVDIYENLFLKKHLKLETSKDVVIERPIFYKESNFDLFLVGFNNNRETNSGRAVCFNDF